VYLKVVASVLPKVSKLTIDNEKRHATDWTKEELIAFLNQAKQREPCADEGGPLIVSGAVRAHARNISIGEDGRAAAGQGYY
jgi:hypothetical protein